MGSKWNKIVQQLKDTDDEGDQDSNAEEEENKEIDEDIKIELVNKSIKDEGSTIISESVNFSVQWLDKICGITPSTKRGQNIYMACMLLIPLIPIFALITQNIILLDDIINRKAELMDIDLSVEKSDEVARLVSNLQQERSEVLLSVFVSNNIDSTVNIGLDLKNRFLQTDGSLDNISNWRSPAGEDIFRSKLRFQIRLDDFRKRVVENNDTSKADVVVEDAMLFYNYATKVLLDDLSSMIKSSNGSSSWRFLIAYKNILRAIESVGIEMSLGIRYQATGKLTNRNFARFIEKHKLSQEYLLQSETFLSDMRNRIKNVRKGKDFKIYDEFYKLLVKGEGTTFEDKTKKLQAILKYFKASVGLMNKLRKTFLAIRINMSKMIQKEISLVDREYVFGILVLAVLFLISPMIVVLIRNAVNALQIFSSSLKSKVRDLRREKRRAETLIYQMLPKSVAESLKSNKQTSELFDSATICFTEIDGFKDIARNCKPLELFDLLNVLYKTFDARIDSYDVYKVETINDSYMVASGLPDRNGDRHAAEIANLCIDLIFITPGILIQHDPNLRLKIRIGIHTGATTAGVVGSKMPRYCLFGDTVNVASRMQSTGEPMKIQMTYETKMLLDNCGGYISDMRGQVEVKGKGLLDTYWLVSRA